MAKPEKIEQFDEVAVIVVSRDAYERIEALAKSKNLSVSEFVQTLVDEGDALVEGAPKGPQLLVE